MINMDDSREIVIPFTPQPPHQNPNIISKSHEESINSYYDCLFVAFLSLRRAMPESKLTLITNKKLSELHQLRLNRLSVKVEIVAFTFQPPEGMVSRFAGCFFLFDAMAKRTGKSVLYLDPDVLCMRNLDFFSHEKGICALNLKGVEYPEVENSKNVEIFPYLQARGLFQPLSRAEFNYFGGELYFVPESMSEILFTKISELWERNSLDFYSGETVLSTEEQLLSVIFQKFPISNALGSIKRVWTSLRFDNWLGASDHNLPLIHLPSEKEFGFARLSKLLSENIEYYISLSDDEWRILILKECDLDKIRLVRKSRRFFRIALLRLSDFYFRNFQRAFK